MSEVLSSDDPLAKLNSVLGVFQDNLEALITSHQNDTKTSSSLASGVNLPSTPTADSTMS